MLQIETQMRRLQRAAIKYINTFVAEKMKECYGSQTICYQTSII